MKFTLMASRGNIQKPFSFVYFQHISDVNCLLWTDYHEKKNYLTPWHGIYNEDNAEA